MKLEEIIETKICHSEEDVNANLKNDFIIIKILQSKSSDESEIKPCFVMGK
ncbi:hypothetical protein KKH23_09060 [Patescibacteria group bacterium]|nr:hypothetical protein [Patescibacteria group bacterium]